jgi:hypothetical protein
MSRLPTAHALCVDDLFSRRRRPEQGWQQRRTPRHPAPRALVFHCSKYNISQFVFILNSIRYTEAIYTNSNKYFYLANLAIAELITWSLADSRLIAGP